VEDRGQWKPDQGCGSAPAENQDGSMFADEHVQVATHQDDQADDADAGR